MVKHCRTKRHIKIKSYEKMSLPGKMCLSGFAREREGREIMSWNQHFLENLQDAGQGTQAVAV